jgi:hypothetical protein
MTAVKLALTADVNLSVTPEARLVDLARQMAGFSPDAAVVAGDLGESLSDFTRCLKLLRQEIACPVWVLPGDHDFWARPPYDSRRLYLELLPQAAEKAGCGWLEGQSFTLGTRLAVAGTVGWYDYSAAAMAGFLSDMEFAQQKFQHNADALRIDWEWSDPEFASLVGNAFLAELDRLEQDSALRGVIAVTHFPVLEQQLIREPGGGFASAYSANLTLGRKMLTRRKLTHLISAHTHKGRQVEVPRDGLPSVDVRVLAGSYEKPAWLGLTLDG